jgi:hypothetical protein
MGSVPLSSTVMLNAFQHPSWRKLCPSTEALLSLGERQRTDVEIARAQRWTLERAQRDGREIKRGQTHVA